MRHAITRRCSILQKVRRTDGWSPDGRNRNGRSAACRRSITSYRSPDGASTARASDGCTNAPYIKPAHNAACRYIQSCRVVGVLQSSGDTSCRKKEQKERRWLHVGFGLAVLYRLSGCEFVDDLPRNEAIIIGVGLGLLMLVINLIRIKDMKKPVWEGVVTEKFHKKNRIR